MTQRDSHRRFGLIGLVLIILAFLAWAFVMPALNPKDATDLPDSITDRPVDRQAPPTLPTSEPPRPMPPTEQ